MINPDEFNGYFYSLISQDTREMHFSTRRQQFLVKQGYSFKLIQQLPLQDVVNPVLSTVAEQKHLLARVLTVQESALDGEQIRGEDEYDRKRVRNANGGDKGAVAAVRRTSSLAARAGGTQRRYEEVRATDNFSHNSAIASLRKL